MKRTLTMNLGGKVFHIDEDAYNLLEEYLHNLASHFDRDNHTDCKTIEEFEAYLSDMVIARLHSEHAIISIGLIREVIEKINMVGGYSAGADQYRQNGKEAADHRYATEESPKRKFYRDMDRAVLCGVCSGIAAYTGWNVNAVRVIVVLMTIVASSLFWMVIVGYLAVWMIAPPAITASQKLEMYGEPITVENIGKRVAADVDTSLHRRNASVLNTLGCMLKGLFVLVGIGFILAVVFGLFGLILELFADGYVAHAPLTSDWISIPSWMILCAAISVFIIVVVPVMAIVFRHQGQGRNGIIPAGLKWLGLTIWLAAAILLAVVFILMTRELGLNFFLHRHSV
ncbi:PspC family transcriptional regulator [Porphyromonas gulae]|uniref:PspC domain-containing protein n=1 Tax=Porphyromonas gulae TaxID=111105 RepID=UPI00052D8B98|nr:PspC domain-containing protein [Porphyromonas gulae]KGO02134.1 PspC family transcriptional regulator [Porphyromonas gulae]